MCLDVWWLLASQVSDHFKSLNELRKLVVSSCWTDHNTIQISGLANNYYNLFGPVENTNTAFRGRIYHNRPQLMPLYSDTTRVKSVLACYHTCTSYKLLSNLCTHMCRRATTVMRTHVRYSVTYENLPAKPRAGYYGHAKTHNPYSCVGVLVKQY